MAKTFNANTWSRLGDVVFRDDMMRRERQDKALGGLMDAAKFVEKTNANRRLQKDWQKYFEDRKAAAEAAKAAEAENAMNDALDVDDSLSYESLAPVASIFGEDMQVPDEEVTSIWSGNGLGGEDLGWNPERIANGYTPSLTPEDYAFLQGFNPKTATPEDVVMVQRIIGTDDDGIWGKNSRAAYRKFMGGV